MTTIQINHDEDIIEIFNHEEKSIKSTFKTKHTGDIQRFLIELFDTIDVEGIEIYQQNEGEIKHVREW